MIRPQEQDWNTPSSSCSQKQSEDSSTKLLNFSWFCRSSSLARLSSTVRSATICSSPSWDLRSARSAAARAAFSRCTTMASASRYLSS